MQVISRLFICIIALFLLLKTPFAQTGIADSARSLAEVVVTTLAQRTNLAGAATRVRKMAAPVFNKSTLVQEMNTIPGMRFEERSPGSYRINIRGSSLRSPFGVRNVKVYWNDIPFTDPGGNTYFNQFVAANLNTLTVFKGPASSLYGQGTGGVITIDNKPAGNTTGVEYLAGSYGHHSLMAKARWGSDSTGSMVTYTHNQGNGYREQTAMRRNNLSWVSEISLNKKQTLNASVLYTDMYYQTPGGLTLKEFEQNPRASRPAVGSFPSAKAINAAIWQKTFTAGATHYYTISNSLTHKTTIYGAYTQVKNSAVRNFERRSEPHFGARTMLSYHKKFGASGSHSFRWDNGAEFQQGYFNMQVANNRNGAPDTLQTNDDISSTVYNFISNAQITLNRWMLVAGASINGNRLQFTRLSEYPVQQQVFQFNEEFAPRMAVMRRFQREWSVAANISKGFSPPTVAELLPSTGVITPLNAEHGWNYEMIVRKNIVPLSIRADVCAYIFKLTDALVQRRDEAGADYFINAGEVHQKGVEAHLSQIIDMGSTSVFDYVENRLSYTFSHFRYGHFIRGADDFTGRKVPGIPDHSVAWRGNIYFKKGFQAGLNYYYASAIFMNDANTDATDPYHLLGTRIGYTKMLGERLSLHIYAGADNLLNQVYSLGNDINAAAGRYYNVAPVRNYYAGVALEWNKKASRE